MQFKNTVAALAVAGTAMGQVMRNMSICDYYTTALLKDNNSTNQLKLLTLLVNTVVIGNYTNTTNQNATMVPGILAPSMMNGMNVTLLPYFDGALASTNRDGKAVAVNFLDDGGAAPLKMNMPANGTSSNQYRLLTHLYQFFGTLLGCSKQGMDNMYPAYGGNPSMFAVHKYMNLNNAQNTYFIQQVGAAAAYFGVANDDIMYVAKTLAMTFNYRCAPNVTIPGLGSQQQAICIASSCPLANGSTCDAYPTAMEPAVAVPSLAMGVGNASAPVTATAANGGKPTGTAGGAGAATSTSAAGGAAHLVGGGVAAGLGIFAFLL